MAEPGFLRTIRISVFGAEKPRRWFGRALKTPAELIDPEQADPRAVLPEPLPTHVEAPAAEPGELHAQRGAKNTSSRGERPERM